MARALFFAALVAGTNAQEVQMECAPASFTAPKIAPNRNSSGARGAAPRPEQPA